MIRISPFRIPGFKADAIKLIAKKAAERKIGARGLRSIMEDIMMDIMYEIPSDESIKKFVVTTDIVNEKELISICVMWLLPLKW